LRGTTGWAGVVWELGGLRCGGVGQPWSWEMAIRLYPSVNTWRNGIGCEVGVTGVATWTSTALSFGSPQAQNISSTSSLGLSLIDHGWLKSRLATSPRRALSRRWVESRFLAGSTFGSCSCCTTEDDEVSQVRPRRGLRWREGKRRSSVGLATLSDWSKAGCWLADDGRERQTGRRSE
jgi:hypothetical protein